jgi:hypothetical protein
MIDIDIYIDILDIAMLPSADILYGIEERPYNWIFMHDNDPKLNWFDEVGVSVLEWPAYSPDLNPIENLWFQLYIECKERKCNNEEELMNTVKKGWNAIPTTRVQDLIDSLSRRIQAVIKFNGLHIQTNSLRKRKCNVY